MRGGLVGAHPSTVLLAWYCLRGTACACHAELCPAVAGACLAWCTRLCLGCTAGFGGCQFTLDAKDFLQRRHLMGVRVRSGDLMHPQHPPYRLPLLASALTLPLGLVCCRAQGWRLAQEHCEVRLGWQQGAVGIIASTAPPW